MRICEIKDCNKKHKGHGFCAMHLARYKGINKIALEAPNKHPHNGEGWLIDKDGYRQIKLNNKFYREHRVIMEDYLQRKLLRSEAVHHINGNKIDNRIENLQLISFSEHRKLHSIHETIKQNGLGFYRDGYSMTDAAKLVGISYSVLFQYAQAKGEKIRGKGYRPLKRI